MLSFHYGFSFIGDFFSFVGDFFLPVISMLSFSYVFFQKKIDWFGFKNQWCVYAIKNYF
tara:strand:+ start:61 stop:237 length:177 start_codon:yes stop_codon:yes gene_type:complete